MRSFRRVQTDVNAPRSVPRETEAHSFPLLLLESVRTLFNIPLTRYEGFKENNNTSKRGAQEVPSEIKHRPITVETQE